MTQGLEAPSLSAGGQPDWASLYRARGDEVNTSRPVFTGDVFENVTLSDGSTSAVIIVQHPCALRSNGVDLNATLLVAPVAPSAVIPIPGWSGSYKKMPLPELDGSASFAASFAELDVISNEALETAKRVAVLSQFGVNLLLQRWVHHNSRAIIPSSDYQIVTSAEYEEADLTEEWCDERTATGPGLGEVTAEAHEWFRTTAGEGLATWQSLLGDPQQRSAVRRAMRAEMRIRAQSL